MAKKKQNDGADTTVAPAASAPGTDRDLALVEAAFAAGNNSMVRALAQTSTSPPAKELAQRLIANKVVLQREQVLAGVVAIIVVGLVAAMTLVRA